MPDSNTTATQPKAVGNSASDLDRLLHNWQSRFTGGRSPSTMALAYMDWLAHAANAPFKTAETARTAMTQWQRLASTMLSGENSIAPSADDHRFANPAWHKKPFNMMTQSVLLGEEWFANMVHDVAGVSPSNEKLVSFSVRQWLDLVSPSNVPWLNPEVIEATRASGGENLITGMRNLLRDQGASHGGDATSGFKVGENIAAMTGKIVFRNTLMELVQYSPATEKVGAEPLLIVPAWIMKYYILDLSPGNSMVGWLVAQGHTVFMISWRNPVADLRDTSLDDYRTEGVMAAIDQVEKICDARRFHAVGYCLGGTLLTIAATAMARDNDTRLASLSLFAAQTDFTEAGALQLFITEDQLNFLNDVMQTQGYLDSGQMGGAFEMLQSNDLIWSHAIRSYMLGEQDAPFDLMAWNADGTRLPARMHIEYLRKLYLNNELAEGQLEIGGAPLVLNDLHLPIFLVGTERDHIAPWHSVFKLHFLNAAEMTFVLTSGGHNAGIVSEPGHAGRHFRIATRDADGHTPGPDEWVARHAPQDGSWWVKWDAWLAARTTSMIAPPPMGAALCDAPGTYVLER
jgi:polyhydroxyalkanoate synthase